MRVVDETSIEEISVEQARRKAAAATLVDDGGGKVLRTDKEGGREGEMVLICR